MNFDNQYKKKISYIDAYIRKYIESYSHASDELVDAMLYSALNGGKRLRSILCTEICNMLNGSIEEALPFACGIELIHAYSLVHDDLPSMDNAQFRRNKLSCHAKYGEAMGILCGDALLNAAYELMLSKSHENKHINAMRIIASSSGANGMISGQVRDLKMSSSCDVTETELVELIEMKTMAIIKAAIVSGAYVADADCKTLNDMSDFAYHLGMAFQIRDDFEDIDEDVQAMNDSPNFINAFGRAKAHDLLSYHSELCKNIISSYNEDSFIMKFLEYLF